MSAFSEQHRRQRAEQLSVHTYMIKPVDFDKLYKVVTDISEQLLGLQSASSSS